MDQVRGTRRTGPGDRDLFGEDGVAGDHDRIEVATREPTHDPGVDLVDEAVPARPQRDAEAVQQRVLDEPDVRIRLRAVVAEAAEFATNDPEPDPSELWTDILI